jgi:hypothetical protein
MEARLNRVSFVIGTFEALLRNPNDSKYANFPLLEMAITAPGSLPSEISP